MPRKGKDITDGEPGLWDLAMADVEPLPGRRKTKPPEVKTPVQTRPAVTRAVLSKTVPEKPGTGQARDVDLRTQQRLERGQMDIEAVLDLHGSGQGAALEKLRSFLQGAHAGALRCVLVITGKGREGDGILRRRLPEWVNEPPLSAIVLKAVPAKAKHGGGGAFYVLLRRQRP